MQVKIYWCHTVLYFFANYNRRNYGRRTFGHGSVCSMWNRNTRNHFAKSDNPGVSPVCSVSQNHVLYYYYRKRFKQDRSTEMHHLLIQGCPAPDHSNWGIPEVNLKKITSPVVKGPVHYHQAGALVELHNVKNKKMPQSLHTYSLRHVKKPLPCRIWGDARRTTAPCSLLPRRNRSD